MLIPHVISCCLMPSRESSPRSAAGAAECAREQLQRTLKVSWDASAGEYTSEQLRDAFSSHGSVEDVLMRERKKKRKGSALVVLATRCGRAAACCRSMPLLIHRMEPHVYK